MTRSALALALALAVLPFGAMTLPAQQYRILTADKVGGEGGFDYVAADSASRRLYVARSGPAGALHVYNLDTLAPLGEVATGSAHGAAIDDTYHHGFATSKPVTMFDTETLKVLKTIDTGGNPDGYLADPGLHRIYILSHSAPNVTVLDAKDGAILGTIDLGGAPEESVIDGHGHLFVDLEDKNAIAVVDTKSLAVLKKYDISSEGGGCAGLAMDESHGILFATCREKSNMIILSAEDGRIITALPTGSGSDGAVFNPATHEAFSSQGDGTLTVVKEAEPLGQHPSAGDFSVEQTLQTPPRAKTITLDRKTGHLFLITAEFGPAPPPQPGQRSRPPMVPGTFTILVVGR